MTMLIRCATPAEHETISGIIVKQMAAELFHHRPGLDLADPDGVVEALKEIGFGDLSSELLAGRAAALLGHPDYAQPDWYRPAVYRAC